MAINPRTGQPETPEEERARLAAAFQPFGFDQSQVPPPAPTPEEQAFARLNAPKPSEMTHGGPPGSGSQLDSVSGVTARPIPAEPEPPPMVSRPNPAAGQAAAPSLEVAGRTVTEKSPEVTRKVESSRTKQGYAALDEAGRRQESAIDQQTANNMQAGRYEANRADMRADVGRYYQLEREQQAAQRQQEIAQLKSAEDKAIGQMEKSSKITTLWEDKGAAANVIQAFLKGLSTYAHIRAGGQGIAPGMQAFTEVEAQDRQKKLDQFARDKEFVNLAKTNKAEAQQAWAQKQHELNLAEIGKLNVVDRQVDSLVAKLKTPEAAAQGAAMKAQLAERRAQLEVERGSHLDATVSSGGTTTQTMVQSKTKSGDDDERAKRTVYGGKGEPLFMIGDDKERKGAQDVVNNLRTFDEAANRLGQLIRSPNMPGSEKAALADQIHGELMNTVRKGEEMGTLDAGTERQLARIIPNGAGLMGNGAVVLKQLRESQKKKAAAKLDGYGTDGAAVVEHVTGGGMPAASPGSRAPAPEGPSSTGASLAEKANALGSLLRDPKTSAADKERVKRALRTLDEQRRGVAGGP